MRVHLIGVSGTGMGALAMLFRDAGHAVSGSDASFDPPIGPALKDAGIACLLGYDRSHIDALPEGALVVVGNAIRRENAEARAVEERGLMKTSMSVALREHFLARRRALVVAGTHGKTTTSAMCAFILAGAGLEPGFFIGGIPKNFGSGAAIGRAKPNLAAPQIKAPFVVEGDEYDAVYWHKRPKFLDYIGVAPDDVAIVTSCEHDHIDIYPSESAYEDAFRDFVQKVPEAGLIVVDAHDPRARAIVAEKARARVAFYALDGDDTGEVTPTWLGALSTVDNDRQQFDLFAGGVWCGRWSLAVPGAHNVRNAIAAVAACAEGFGVDVTRARTLLLGFEGVKRRQELLGAPRQIKVYDDFAHHPTAVDETLRALKRRHPEGALWAVFEPRSATAVRSLHQEAYASAFAAADHIIFAPLGRANVPESERLDVARLARAIGEKAEALVGVDAIVDRLAASARPGDTIAILSNGAFGGLHQKLLARLEES
jgi:UDP-N-acetylmuramate: L-alanyl-gamma-D-glutamyl-meso-diaminopimelate ligase